LEGASPDTPKFLVFFGDSGEPPSSKIFMSDVWANFQGIVWAGKGCPKISGRISSAPTAYLTNACTISATERMLR